MYFCYDINLRTYLYVSTYLSTYLPTYLPNRNHAYDNLYLSIYLSDDGIHAVKTLISDPRVLPGAGAVELELSRRLKLFADEEKGVDQYAIRKVSHV